MTKPAILEQIQNRIWSSLVGKRRKLPQTHLPPTPTPTFSWEGRPTALNLTGKTRPSTPSLTVVWANTTARSNRRDNSLRLSPTLWVAVWAGTSSRHLAARVHAVAPRQATQGLNLRLTPLIQKTCRASRLRVATVATRNKQRPLRARPLSKAAHSCSCSSTPSKRISSTWCPNKLPLISSFSDRSQVTKLPFNQLTSSWKGAMATVVLQMHVIRPNTRSLQLRHLVSRCWACLQLQILASSMVPCKLNSHVACQRLLKGTTLANRKRLT
jgi:hypothetical protein